MTKYMAPQGDKKPLDAEVVALIMAALLSMESQEKSGLDYRVRIRESWPRTTLWRWL